MNRSWIESRIPHRGRMCLLEEVLSWDAQGITCRSCTHRAADHPLRSHGRLGAAAGIEYAAQSMAVHGALTSAADAPRPEAGFLASLRDVDLFVERLDDIDVDLISQAGLIASDAGTALYDFELSAAGRPLLRGRAAVVFDAGGVLR